MLDLIHQTFYFLYIRLPFTLETDLYFANPYWHLECLQQIYNVRCCEEYGWQFEPHGPVLECLEWL